MDLQLQNKGLNVVQATQMAMMEMQNQQMRLGARMQQLERNANDMRAKTQTMQRRVGN